ncbi:MAG: hypothetical protein P4L90_09250, partial [Rhodopila sp.]|nr:hypothetical protein [Rhodopila sp.]
MRVLRGSLPLLDDDAAEGWGRQDRAAMAAVAALRPANAAEGQLAAQFVLAEAWAADCLRLAGERRREMAIALKCKAQALSFMREAKSAWRLLLKAQAERMAIEKDAEAASRAEWAEHAVVGMMAEGLAAPAAPEAPDAPAVPEAGDGRELALPVGGGAEDVSEFGFGLNDGTNSPGMRRETGTRLRGASARAPVFA